MIAPAALLSAFASAFTQDQRLFSAHFSDPSLDVVLLPHSVQGEEHVSAPYRLTLDCLSSDMHHELKSFLGLGIDIVIHREDGDRRLSGIVTSARQLGADGGFARYSLCIEPALATLRLRRNSRVFQDKSVIDIVGLILDEHIQNNPVFAQCFRHRDDTTQDYPPRSFCQQYRESDFAFIERLLREEGISYRFDFDHGDDEPGLHTLALFDSGSSLPVAMHSAIRFHRADATESDDAITEWNARRTVRSGASSLASFDYKGVYTQQGAQPSAIDQGEAGSALAGNLEDFDPQALYYGSGNGELARYSLLRQQANDLQAKRFSGRGVVRGLGAGQSFALQQHPIHDEDAAADREFVVLSQRLIARNNLPQGFDALAIGNAPGSDEKEHAGYWNDISAVRKTVPIVPAYSHGDHARPTARGVQTATVVGPSGEETFTDELGRIKVQFHWARPQDHDSGVHGAGADRDDFSSCWIRVGYPSAGANWGHQFIPRIGQEVVVDFIEGDIDRPIVSAVVYNGQHAPPTFSGAGSLPANKTLSGIKSKEFGGGGYNEILFDDSTQEIRTKLSSEHGKTQLNQGFLIHPRSEGEGKPRGEGVELRTDNAGALRAAQGLLITTEPQPDAAGKQLDRQGALTQLDAAVALADQLGDTAKSAKANQPETGRGNQTINGDSQSGSEKKSGHLHHIKNAAQNLERKTNTDRNGASGSGGDQSGQQPLLMLSGQNGIALTTPQSAAIATGTNLDQLALADSHQTTGRRWIGNAAESISLFVAGAQNKLKESFKLIAAKGNIQMQAQSADIEIDGDQSLTITACKETITASAQKEIRLTCAGAQIKLSGGNIDVIAPGNISLKGAKQPATGPTQMNPVMPVMPNSENSWVVLESTYNDKWKTPWPLEGLKVNVNGTTVSDSAQVRAVEEGNG